MNTKSWAWFSRFENHAMIIINEQSVLLDEW